MTINSEWVIEYIKKHGTDIIIPKDVEIIEQGAFDNLILDNEFGEGYSENTFLTLKFDNGSKLSKIESGAFSAINISNEIIIPDSVEIMGQLAFYSAIYNIRFGKNSRLKDIGLSNCMSFPNKMIIPSKIKTITIGEFNGIKELIISEESEIENVQIDRDGVYIILPSGIILKSSEEKHLKRIAKCGNNWKIFYKKGDDYLFEIIDGSISNELVLESGSLLKVWNPDGCQFEDGIYLYKSIFDLDTDNILDDEKVMLETDYLSTAENNLVDNGGRNVGYMYSKQEVIEIKNVLNEIIKKVNIPPENVKDREKIIYAQIVQNLFEYLKYDYETLNLIEEKEFDYDKSTQEIVHSSQNMKGILKGNTVCKGFSTVINSLTYYFGIHSKSITNEDHAWNYIILDGKKYEDDFTWYRDSLAVSNIMGIDTFLGGKNLEGKRKFSGLRYHNIGDDIELDESISSVQQLNLLATDWTKVKDWSNIDLNSSSISNKMVDNLFKFASNHRFLLSILLKNKEINSSINAKMIDGGRSVKR